MIKEWYPHRVWLWRREWTPDVTEWLNKNVDSKDWVTWKDPEDYGEDTPELDYLFRYKQDAVAFKLRFK